MKKTNSVILLISIFAFQLFAQDGTSSSVFRQFLIQISDTSTFEEIEKTISKAGDVYRKEKENAGKDQKKLAKIIIDFAGFRKNIEEILTEKIRTTKKDANFLKSTAKSVGIRRKNSEELIKLYHEAIDIYGKNPSWEDLQIAGIKYQLARSQMVLDPEVADISSRFGKRSMTWKEKRERLSDTQTLFSQALDIQEKLLPKNDDATLVTMFHYAQSLMESADFEKALFLYGHYIAGIETKYGKKSKALLPALEIYAALLQLIEDVNSVDELSKQIESISGKKINVSDSLLFVTPRTKSFDYDGITGKDGAEVLDLQNYTRINPRADTGVSLGVIGSGGLGSLLETSTSTVPFIGRILKRLIKVIVLIDENGKVIEATPLTEDEKLKKKVEENVLKWEFTPFIYKNERKKMKGIIYYFKK